VLGYNYPGSRWYGDAYALVTGGGNAAGGGEGWLGRIVSGVF
jgi:outer membrane protein assembly factor BamD